MTVLLKTFKTILLKTAVYSLIIGVLSALLKYTGMVPAVNDYWYWIELFYFTITILIFYQLLHSLQKSSRRFVASFFIISLGRILLFTAIVLLYATYVKTNAISFILTFAVYYILFTFWEVILILPVIKNNKITYSSH